MGREGEFRAVRYATEKAAFNCLFLPTLAASSGGSQLVELSEVSKPKATRSSPESLQKSPRGLNLSGLQLPLCHVTIKILLPPPPQGAWGPQQRKAVSVRREVVA